MKIMSVDFGDARTGIACCDRDEILATPQGVIAERDISVLVKKLSEKAMELGAQLIVVGNPLNMDGTEGERSAKAKRLAESLYNESRIEVVLYDERRTTHSAINILNESNVRGKKRKQVVDAVAAVIILEGYLAHRKNMSYNVEPEKDG